MGEAGRNPGRIIPGVLLAFADAHRDAGRLRIIGEPIWPGRGDVEYPACVQHEALINMAFAGRAVTILCPYDVEGLPAAVLADAEVTHPAVIDASGVRVSTRYAADRVFAEYNRPLPEPSQPQTVLPSPLSPSHARRVAVELARRTGLAPDRVADLELAINELVTDSVEDPAMPALRFWLQDGHLVAELRIAGDLEDPLVGRRPVEARQTWGRGLLLVNQLAGLVCIHSAEQHTTIRMYLTVTRRTAPGWAGATELRDAISAADTAAFMLRDGTTSRIHRPEIHQAIGMVLTQLGGQRDRRLRPAAGLRRHRAAATQRCRRGRGVAPVAVHFLDALAGRLARRGPFPGQHCPGRGETTTGRAALQPTDPWSLAL